MLRMHRRHALGAGPAARLLAGRDRLARAAPTPPSIERVLGEIGRNHGHVLAVSVADVLVAP